jgi:hypothetical protein
MSYDESGWPAGYCPMQREDGSDIDYSSGECMADWEYEGTCDFVGHYTCCVPDPGAEPSNDILRDRVNQIMQVRKTPSEPLVLPHSLHSQHRAY